ncbi:hypothetical protein [Streptomyces lydicus]|uniref:hypothetical protein n=1 Tax=Streptomyces lydicus TaxID=47763 RepID=UPI0036E7A133
MKTLTPAPIMSAADIAAHESASHVRISPEIGRAVARYEVAVLRVEELGRVDARRMTGAQFDSLALAQDTITECRRVLAQAGLLHLIAATAGGAQ